MAKNRLFGWMFVEDSNKEPKPTVEPVKQEISVVVPTPTPPIVAAGDVDTKLLALKNSEMWFEKLKKLEEYANLTIQDVTNEVNIRKKTFERIRAQHKAFKSVMSETHE